MFEQVGSDDADNKTNKIQIDYEKPPQKKKTETS